MAIKQLSIFLENKKGQMAEVVKSISDAKVNIRAMSVADSQDFGILRLIVSDLDKAKAVIATSAIAKETDVIAVKMDDIEGALYKVLEVLDIANINVDYSYAFTGSRDLGAYVVFRVDDVTAAEKLLREKGFTFINEDDI